MSEKSLEKFDVLVKRGRLAQTTREIYVSGVKDFVNAMNLGNVDAALTIIQGMENKERFMDEAIDVMMRTMSNVKIAKIFTSLKRWLQLNGVSVDWGKVAIPSVELTEEDRIATKDELRRLLNVVSLRDKALILFALSSGVRRRAILTLKFGDVNFDYSDVAAVTVKRKYTIKGKVFTTGRKISKKRNFYITFITPEAKKMLLEYKRQRELQGEQITDESPLFTSTRRYELGKFLSCKYLDNHWSAILRRAFLAEKSIRWHTLHFHTLKKYAETQMINAGVKESYREFFLGHKGAYLEMNYFRGEEERCLEEYRKAIPYLSVIEVPPSLEDLKRRQEIAETLMDKSMRGIPWTDEDRENVRRYGIALQERPRPMLEDTESNGGSMEGDCGAEFEEINESDLLGYLRSGWRITHNLRNGRVIVQKS